MKMRNLRTGLLLLPALLITAAPLPAAVAQVPELVRTETTTTLTLSNGSAGVEVQKSPWRMSLLDGAGKRVASEVDPRLPDQQQNPTYEAFAAGDGNGHDVAYPGLPTVSTRPLAFLRGGTWQHVTGLRGTAVDGRTARLDVTTSDSGTASGGTVVLTLRDSAVDVEFRPAGAPVDAVAESFSVLPTERFFGGGQRFQRPELTGQSVPLWISHGPGSDRQGGTNEIAIPYLASTGGWALAERSGARGELDVSVAARPGVISAVLEVEALSLTLYAGSLQQALAAYTADTGRNPVPPRWAFRPMFWQDEDTQDGLEDAVARLKAADIPVGVYWLDNPWMTQQGDFTNGRRYPDLEGLLTRLHAQDVRVMTWVSPYVSDGSRLDRTGARRVGDLPPDGYDATYVPPRKLDPHLDLTDAATYEAFVAAAADLLARGVDGLKLDRGEEDLGEASTWANGKPNRLQHNPYVVRYAAAMREACQRTRRDDCFLLARGGAAGSSAHVANWAADSLPVEGSAGLRAALSSLLSLSLSGQPVSGSDVGGYAGVQETQGTNPTAGLLARWAWLGALSPVFESAVDPLRYDPETVRAVRRAAVVHDRLADYSRGLAEQAATDGIPAVRHLALAFPDDPAAVAIDDEYLYGPDLLVAPVTVGVSQPGPTTRSVYLPAGTWTNVFSGQRLTGPVTVPVVSGIDEMPLFLREGASLPMSTFADLDAPTTGPTPVVPEAPAAVLLPLIVAGLLGVAAHRRRFGSACSTRG